MPFVERHEFGLNALLGLSGPEHSHAFKPMAEQGVPNGIDVLRVLVLESDRGHPVYK